MYGHILRLVVLRLARPARGTLPRLRGGEAAGAEKTELEIAKQTLKNSKDPAEREKVQQKYDALLEKDIASDKEVIAACSNGNAGSSACASARLKVIASKEGYEDGPYKRL